jgi:hypothetical protein
MASNASVTAGEAPWPGAGRGHPVMAALPSLDHSAVVTWSACTAAAISRAAVVSISEISPAAAKAAAKPARVASRCPARRSAVTSRAVPTNSRPRPSGLGRLAELHASQTACPSRCRA